MVRYRKQKLNGSIALITIIVISGILLASGIAVVMVAMDLALSSEGYLGKVRADIATRTCLEESLFRVKADDSFTGNVSYSNGASSCTGLVEDDPVTPGVKVISVDSVYEEFTAGEVFYVDVSVEPFQILN